MERYSKWIILFVFLGTGLFILAIFYHRGKRNYDRQLAQDIHGIITKKYDDQESKKLTKVQLNDSAVLVLPFGLQAELNEGDTIAKNSGDSTYIFKTHSSVIRATLIEPNFFGYPKDWKGKIDVIKR